MDSKKHQQKHQDKQQQKDKKQEQKHQQNQEDSDEEQENQDFGNDQNLIDEEVVMHQQIAVQSRSQPNQNDYHTRQRLIVVLEQATLEIAQTKKGIELINCDDHERLILKMKRSPEDFRPDIAHQCLLALMDTPINKAGKLQIYIRTSKNVLIEINPAIRIPRTFKRFSGLMAQLLTKQRIAAPVDENSTMRSQNESFLMKVIRPPLEQYFPKGAKRIGTSVKGKLVTLREFVREDVDVLEKPIVFAVGCTSIGNAAQNLEYADQTISVSNYPLSAQCVCSKLCNTFTDFWNIM